MKGASAFFAASSRNHRNSDLPCDQFLKGAEETGHSIQKIRLAEKQVAPCLACDVCRSGKPCTQQDDMAETLETVIGADVILLATPVYFYSMDAQMKLFIDRCYARFMEMKGKNFYFVLSLLCTWQVS